jgi:O-antigen/teichoic acid export membrane protein
MIFVLFIGLISVRFILENLGIEDYGIYNVVFGVLGILTFFSNSIVDSCQRFFSIEVQNKDFKKLSIYFSYSFFLTLIIGTIFIILSETIGINFVIDTLSFPADRINAVKIIFHISVVGFFFQIITLPFNSLIIAYEKMKVFAYISMIEVILKFIGVLMLFYFSTEKIILYTLFISTISFFVFLIYFIYCRIIFKKVKIAVVNDHIDLKATYTFFSWNMLGSLASVLKNQGTNTVLNIFYGPVLNTARGIAFQLNGVINTFVFNFTQAVKLQIYKYYAESKFDELHELVVKSSKYQFFIVILISYPLLFETEFILNMWLKDFPYSALIFTKLAIILSIVDSLSYSFMAAVLATGKIKIYSILVGSLIILNIPFSYYFLYFDYLPQTTILVSISISIIAFFVRLYFYSKYYTKSKLTVSKDLLIPTILVLLTSLILPYLVITNYESSLLRFIISSLSSIIGVIIFTYLFGIDLEEKIVLKKIIKNYINKLS